MGVIKPLESNRPFEIMGHFLTAFLLLFFVDPLSYLVFFLLWFTFIYLAIRKRINWSFWQREKILFPLAGLFILGILAGLWAPGKATWLNYLGKDLHYLLFLCFVVYLFKVKDLKERWIYSTMFATIVLIVYGLYEYFFIRTRSWYRLRSLYGNPNHFGGVMIMTLPLFFALTLDRTKKIKYRILSGLVSLSGIFVVIFSQSRSSWLALLAGLIIIVFLRNFKVGLVSLIVISLSLVLIYPVMPEYLQQRLQSIASWSDNTSRTELWQAGFLMWQENPLLGVGTGGYTYLLSDYLTKIKGTPTTSYLTHPHNIIIYILAEYGLIGMAIFIYFLVVLFKKSLNLIMRLNKANYFLTAGVLASLGGLGVNLMTDHVIANRAIGMLALFFLAVLNHLGNANESAGVI